MSIEPRDFRDTVGCFATGITIITTIDADGSPIGLTANSFSSLSLDPPLVLFCLDRKVASFDAFKAGQDAIPGPFEPHILAANEIRTFAQMRRELGPDIALMIDCGGLHTPQSAHRLMAGLDPLNMLFVEEPLEQSTVEPYLRLKRDFPQIPLAAGERWMTRWDCREWFERQAIDVCQVDISHTGGISELMRIAAFAEIYGIRVAPHNPYGPVALAAASHAAAAMPNFLILEHCRLQPHFDQVQLEAVPLEGGYVNIERLGERPGLGVTLDFDYMQDYGYVALASDAKTMFDGAKPLY